MNWKTCSVEAGGGISKLRRLAGVSAVGARSRNPERSEGSVCIEDKFVFEDLVFLLAISWHFVWDAKTRVDDVRARLL